MKLMIPHLRLRARDMQASIWNSPSLAYCSSLEGQSRIPQNYSKGQLLAKPGEWGLERLFRIHRRNFLLDKYKRCRNRYTFPFDKPLPYTKILLHLDTPSIPLTEGFTGFCGLLVWPVRLRIPL